MTLDEKLPQADHDYPINLILEVEKSDAGSVRSLIMELGLFDPDRSIGSNGKVHFPIIFGSSEKEEEFRRRYRDLQIRTDPRIIRKSDLISARDRSKTPVERVRKILDGIIPSELLEHLPGKYERIGDCLVLRIPDRFRHYRTDIASSFMEVLRSRYVLEDRSGVYGELREPSMEVLMPPENGAYEVVHREGRVRYHLDPRKVMFSSGNIDERSGLPGIIKSLPPPPRLDGMSSDMGPERTEVVVDMFAGIGYFTLPLSLDVSIKRRILAIELNPISHGYLVENVSINGVQDIVTPILGDNRKVLPGNIADRIIMGYVGGTMEFLDRALELSSRDGCIIHLHETVEVEKGINGLFEEVKRHCSDRDIHACYLSGRKVKSYAPRIDHVVIDILIRKKDRG